MLYYVETSFCNKQLFSFVAFHLKIVGVASCFRVNFLLFYTSFVYLFLIWFFFALVCGLFIDLLSIFKSLETGVGRVGVLVTESSVSSAVSWEWVLTSACVYATNAG